MTKIQWSVSDISEPIIPPNWRHVENCVEFQDRFENSHVFHIVLTKERIVFGGCCNVCFIESGYILRDEYGRNVAAYSPDKHEIYMPHPEQFNCTEAYYKTLFHEITHAMSKENGEKLDAHFGSEPYGKEELVAELGANFLLSYCGIESEKLADNSAAYLKGWCTKIAQEPKILLSAASKAQRRFDIVLKLLGVKEEREETEELSRVAVAA